MKVRTSMQMLKILEQEKWTYFAEIITGDELGPFLEYSRNHLWRLGNKNAPERFSYQIDTGKRMLTIF
jgi:hypothetical protein